MDDDGLGLDLRAEPPRARWSAADHWGFVLTVLGMPTLVLAYAAFAFWWSDGRL